MSWLSIPFCGLLDVVDKSFRCRPPCSSISFVGRSLTGWRSSLILLACLSHLGRFFFVVFFLSAHPVVFRCFRSVFSLQFIRAVCLDQFISPAGILCSFSFHCPVFPGFYVKWWSANYPQTCRGVARNLLMGEKEGVWETELPQRDPGAKPRSGAKPPEAGDVLNIRLNKYTVWKYGHFWRVFAHKIKRAL